MRSATSWQTIHKAVHGTAASRFGGDFFLTIQTDPETAVIDTLQGSSDFA